MTIGHRLKGERTRLGLTQGVFSSLGAVATNAQGNYESDKRVPDALYLEAVAKAGVDVQFVVTGRRAHEIDVTLFGICEAALRDAYQLARGHKASGPFRANQICKLYNVVAREITPEDDVHELVRRAADDHIEFAQDPSDPKQIDRVLLHTTVK